MGNKLEILQLLENGKVIAEDLHRGFADETRTTGKRKNYLYYLDVNFYRYFIGRDDQSVNEKVMIKRIDQQIRVNKLMVDAYINCKSTNKQLKAYMFSYLDIITTISSIMLIRANTEESLQKKKELLEYIRTENKQVYRKLRHSLFGRVMNLPGRGGRKMSVAAYKISQKFYGFN